MLNSHATDVIAHQHVQELHAEADQHRLAKVARSARRRPPWRARMGWWMVAAGLRLALRDRVGVAVRRPALGSEPAVSR